MTPGAGLYPPASLGTTRRAGQGQPGELGGALGRRGQNEAGPGDGCGRVDARRGPGASPQDVTNPAVRPSIAIGPSGLCHGPRAGGDGMSDPRTPTMLNAAFEASMRRQPTAPPRLLSPGGDDLARGGRGQSCGRCPLQHPDHGGRRRQCHACGLEKGAEGLGHPISVRDGSAAGPGGGDRYPHGNIGGGCGHRPRAQALCRHLQEGGPHPRGRHGLRRQRGDQCVRAQEARQRPGRHRP